MLMIDFAAGLDAALWKGMLTSFKAVSADLYVYIAAGLYR